MKEYNQGWVKLHRKFLDWEWYDDLPTKVLFLHLILKANHTEQSWRGITIKRGQRLTSLEALSSETSLSIKQVRRAIKNLEKTGELGKQTTRQYSLLTMHMYDTYQDEGKQRANEGHTEGKRRANEGQLIKNDNKENKVNNENKRPSLSEVINYFSDNKQSTKKASEMYEYYENLTEPRHKYWRDKNSKPVKNWKNKAKQVWFEDEIAEEHCEPTKEEIIEQCISQHDAKIYIRQIEEKEKFKIDKVQLAKDYLKACEQHGKNLSPARFPGWVSMNQLWIIDKYKPQS